MSETTRAGRADSASLPALTRERCLRTVLSSMMSAPPRRRMRVHLLLSSSERPSIGRRTGPIPLPRSGSDEGFAARLPDQLDGPAGAGNAVFVGNGVAASISSIAPAGAPSSQWPYLVTTTPPRTIPPISSRRAPGHGAGGLAECDDDDVLQGPRHGDRADPLRVALRRRRGGRRRGSASLKISMHRRFMSVLLKGAPSRPPKMPGIVSRKTFGAWKRA